MCGASGDAGNGARAQYRRRVTRLSPVINFRDN
jgi:hypothetical protein